ncbi:KxYKxGKxW signal peptide domain-containing protein, partial [Lacticaseibacillus thailandensis]
MTLRGETKVHYKMFKSGKKWVIAGIAVAAMVPIMMAPTVLAPLAPVRAADNSSVDKSATGLLNHYFPGSSWASDEIKTAVDEGAFIDATPSGYGTVSIGSPDYVKTIAAAGLRLTINGNTWTISPRDSSKNVELSSVLSSFGVPSASVLAAPTSAANMQTILTYLNGTTLNSMNGGKGLTSGFPYSLLSGGEMDMTDNVPFTGATTDGYSAITAGNVTLTNNNSTPTGNVLITDGGSLTGTGTLPNAIANSISKYQFSTDSLVTTERAIKTAALAIGKQLVANNSTPVAAVAGNSEIDLDFSKAKAENGTYVFTVDATKLGNLHNDFVFKNASDYDGSSKVVINVTGGSGATMTVPGIKSDSTKLQRVYLTSTDGTTLDLTNEQFGIKTTLLAPTSNVKLSGSATISGFVGAINGDGSGDGYVATTTPSNPTNPTTPTTSTYTVQFVDKNNGNKVVGTTTVDGTAGDSKTVTVPNGWVLASGASNTVKLTDDPSTPIQVPVVQVKTATVTQTITSTAVKSVTDNTPVTDNDTDDQGNTITYAGKVSDLPQPQTRTTTVKYTVEGTGDNAIVNVLSGAADGVVFDPIAAQDVSGWIEDQTSVANTYLDESTLISKLKTLDSEDGNVAVAAQLIYYPSSTSVHKTMTFTDHVSFEFSDDTDGDWDQLPDDFDRNATVGYTETTNYNGTVTKSNFAIEDGGSLPDVTAAQIASWNIDGYTNDASTASFQTDADVISTLEQSGGQVQAFYTVIQYKAADVQLHVTYVDDVTGDTVTVANSEVTGLNGSTGEYTVVVPDGYALAANQAATVSYQLTADDTDDITVHLTHVVDHTSAATTRTINYVYAGTGAKAADSVTQTLSWNVATDEVTGASVATPAGEYAAVTSP